jgi:hypothetical protein
LRLLLLGLAAFLLGHATFLVVMSILFTPTGMGNRVLVAAAIGVAMIFIALMAWTRGVAGRRGRLAFPVLVGIVVGLAALRTSFVAQHWAAAHSAQQGILSSARRDLGGLPAGATVLLDGVCPYIGPGVVFETWWDVAGALSLTLGRPIKGDAVSARTSLSERGVETSIYKEPAVYPYGRTLFVYNPAFGRAVRLSSEAAARRYFAQPGRWPTACPASFVGHGTDI